MLETTSEFWDQDRHANDPFEPGPVTVVRREPLAPNLQLLTVRAPTVAAKIQPGQFVVVRADKYGERIPLTVADWDSEAGTVTCAFLQIGTSTYKLGDLNPGDTLATFVGPLGKAPPWPPLSAPWARRRSSIAGAPSCALAVVTVLPAFTPSPGHSRKRATRSSPSSRAAANSCSTGWTELKPLVTAS
jgi:hypothetical protein